MVTTDLFYRRTFLVCGILTVLVAIAVALFVVPLINNATAVTAFQLNIGLNLLSVISLVYVAIRSKEPSLRTNTVLIVTGTLLLLLGLALADAGMAYHKHASSMQFATIVLFTCSVVDFLVGITVILGVFLRDQLTMPSTAIIARGRKLFFIAITLYSIAIILALTVQEGADVMVVISVFTGILGFFHLAKALDYTIGASIGIVILIAVPLVGLFALMVLYGKATKALREADKKVGPAQSGSKVRDTGDITAG